MNGKLRCVFYVFSGLFLTSLTTAVHGQEMLGISNSNFAGNMGMSLNPSLFVGSPYLNELNYLSGDFFADNDFAYVKRRTRLFSKSLNGEQIPEEQFGDYYTTPPKNMYGSVNLRGPSMIVNKDNYSWGFHTALRSAVSATDVPLHVAKFIKDGLDYDPQHGINYTSTPFRAASAVWAELGGTYGKKIYEKRDKEYLAAAVTVKLLAGFDGFYASFSDFDYIIPSSDVMQVNSVTGEYGHALSDGRDGAASKPFKIRGWGGGLDLGLTYYRKKVHGASDCNKTAEKLKKYNYRAGLSLIDIGMIRFTRQTGVYSFNNNSAYWTGLDSAVFNSTYELDSAISMQFYGDPEASKSASKMNIFLPTALSFQFDYCVTHSVYLNATVVQGVPLSKKYAIVRASQAALSARYETRKWEVALPLTFYEYSKPHLGVALRYWIFVVGTDRLGSFTGIWDATGYDFFFGFKSNFCEPASKRRKKPDCPAYIN
ncbi:MAG TPA: DUF5723 family protein [Bacteroidia bacterium]|nr:DUF5723 family protein [Bacteroidia bacterium]